MSLKLRLTFEGEIEVEGVAGDEFIGGVFYSTRAFQVPIPVSNFLPQNQLTANEEGTSPPLQRAP